MIKHYFLCLVLGIWSYLGYTQSLNKAVITADVKGEFSTKDEVNCIYSINDGWFPGTKNSIKNIRNKQFTVELPTAKAMVVTIHIFGKSDAKLIIEPGNIYHISFDLDSHTEEISVNGKYNKALNYYNENIKSPDYYISTNRIPVLENGTPEEAYQHLDKRRLKNLDFFEGQIKTNQISKDFYNVVSSNINTYYNAYKIFLGGQRRWVTSTKMNEKSFFEKTVKELYPKEVPSSDYDLSSSWTFNLMDFYLKYAFFNEGGDPKNIEDWHSFTLKQAHKYFQGKALEFYIAYYLGMQILTCKDNDKGLIDQVEKFQVKFPESNYSEHLRKSLQPIISYHQKLANIKKNDNVEVLKNYTGINTLRELLESLKGKRWYVDIWGTWCGPCKQEFKHKKELSRLLKANDIETIYICEGNYSKEEVWKEMITYYDLEGKHLFANSKLVKDYIAKLSGDGSFTYPRYLLVNEQGEIVHKYAHKPSELLQLEKDIYKSFK